MRRKNDILLKSAFEEAFSDLLRFFFKDTDSLFDIEKGFEFMDKELHELFPDLEKQGGSRFVDMLVKIYGTNGLEEWMLIHIEIQAQKDQQFSKRMFQYFYRIYDRYDVPVTHWRCSQAPEKVYEIMLLIISSWVLKFSTSIITIISWIIRKSNCFPWIIRLH